MGGARHCGMSVQAKDRLDRHHASEAVLGIIDYPVETCSRGRYPFISCLPIRTQNLSLY